MASAPNALNCGIWMDPNFDDHSDVPHFWPSSPVSEEQYRITGYEFAAQVQRDVALLLPDLIRLLLVRILIEGRTQDDVATAIAYRLQDRKFPVDSPELRRAFKITLSTFYEVADLPSLEALERSDRVIKKLISAVSPELTEAFGFEPGFTIASSADQILGAAWSKTFLDFLLQENRVISWDPLAATFLSTIGMIADVHVLAPADVAGNAAMLREFEHLDDAWARRAASAVARMAESFGRYDQLPARAAAALRLAVLGLTRDRVVQPDLDFGFPLKIVASTMVMEKRARGELPPNETIVLAVS